MLSPSVLPPSVTTNFPASFGFSNSRLVKSKYGGAALAARSLSVQARTRYSVRARKGGHFVDGMNRRRASDVCRLFTMVPIPRSARSLETTPAHANSSSSHCVDATCRPLLSGVFPVRLLAPPSRCITRWRCISAPGELGSGQSTGGARAVSWTYLVLFVDGMERRRASDVLLGFFPFPLVALRRRYVSTSQSFPRPFFDDITVERIVVPPHALPSTP